MNDTMPAPRRNPARPRATINDQAQLSPPELSAAIPIDEQETNNETNIKRIATFIATRFVRREGKFYVIKAPSGPISATDLKRVAFHQVSEAFPNLKLSDELWAAICKRAINDTHTDKDQSVAVWNGKQACLPAETSSLYWEDAMASLNTWMPPEYRKLGIEDSEDTLFDELLDRIFPHPEDRFRFKDWLSWNLQNEADKPAWSVLLYSQSKGTGKSTLGRLLGLLFGEDNSMPLNGVTKLTGRFNKTVLVKKFIACEEVKLKAGTDAGNSIKALISEKEIAVEGKGTNTESIQNVCVFLMTTNHYPHWIEPDDRRFYVIDVNHSGHASGPDHEEFGDFMKVFYDYMKEPANIARLRNALLAHRQANSFNPRALNVSEIDTPIMQSISQASGQVLQQALEELIASSQKFAIPQRNLMKLFSERLKANPNRIVHMMNELGWRSSRCKWGGVDYGRVIWVHPDYQVANGRVLGPDSYDEAVDAVEDEVELI
ncbi:hypothetical protein ASD8599_03088 [Ascidiaceihabitans donghaensis]|uniref:NrS-1 polymerase-like helicase domain-containing protein n=1 Tax=Ascidiaceihabitans donghaensis TaxID=1510460 RepID=A0A2R8BGU1_9RHOB|nr:primase-helicase family protein [Ascidiaceihabitans donghaensis]SPH22344.1 hypothetical protein ASD8599_03088 [Ascidiaceihabitans donghaensis]